MASAAGHVVDSPEQPVTNVQQLPGQVQMSSAQNTAPGSANTVPASPTARHAPGAHGAGTNHADAKLLAAIRHELESSRGHLSVQRRRELAARLMEHTSHDDTFFTKLTRLLQEAGVVLPSVTVEYRNLRIETEALVGSASIPTVANVPLTFLRKLFGVHSEREAKPLTILNDLQGRLVPGRLTLLLGPPSCGKSSFMRALTGRLMPAQGRLTGDVRYNGHPLEDFNVRRTAGYVEQIDNHNPNFTVRETLDFAHTCQVGLHGARIDVPAEVAAHRLASARTLHHHDDGGVESASTYGLNGANGGGGGYSGYSAHSGTAGPGTPKSTNGQNGHGPNGHGNGHGNGYEAAGNGGGGGGGGSQHPQALSASARLFRSLRGNREKGLLQQAKPHDEFEALLRQSWGTNVRVDIVMSLLGLAHCSETLVGDALMRGISGGERKRLTAAELLVGGSNVLMLDEMSTGLDSATLFTVVRWLRQATMSMQLTMLVSLLQPPPEVFGLFDDVLLMTEGRVLYHGPVSDVVPHFRSLGLECPDRKDVPSFLLEITTPLGQRQFAGPELRQRFNLPPPGVDLVPASRTGSAALDGADPSGKGKAEHRSSVEGSSHKGHRPQFHAKSLLIPLPDMEAAFWTQNQHGVAMVKELNRSAEQQQHLILASNSTDPHAAGTATAVSSSVGGGALAAPLIPKSERFALKPWEAVCAATRRQVTLVLRDRVLLRGRLVQVTVLGLITGSLFYNQGVSLPASRTIFGACFMCVLFMSFGGFMQVPLMMEQKKVWYKQRASAFLPAYAQSLALALSQFPISIAEATVFSVIMYWMIGLYGQPGYFFTFCAVMISASLAISSLFRFFGVVCPSLVISNAATGVTFIFLVLTSGFTIVHYSIPPWAIWAYWISPYAFAVRALVINEMVSPKWQNVPAPGGPPGMSLGDAALLSFDFYTTREWIWIGVGFLNGFYILFTLATAWCLAYLNPEVPAAQLPDPEEVANARARAEARHAEMQKLALAKAPSMKQQQQARSTSVAIVKTDSVAGDPISGKGDDSEAGPKMVLSPSMAAIQDYIDISSSLPFTPITLVFQDLKYWVPNPAYSRRAARKAAEAAAAAGQAAVDAHAAGKDVEAALPDKPPAGADQPGGGLLPLEARERLQLLSGITGFNEPGVLLALMGGSGAGKTTLMDVIAGRKTVGEIGGTITVNGHKAEPRAWSRVMGYVEQFDIHTPAQTVLEALHFSARLRLPQSFSDAQVRAYVEEVAEIVDLTPQLGALVGSPGVSGLSTEGRKRLTIAVELVANPSCLFLDEPTSGLDARAAAIVMRAVRNVARNGRTVMVTIHQPSIEIFESFDQLLLIQRGGRTTYFGPLGLHSADLINYFMEVPGTPPLPSGFNPATWMLEVTGGSMATVLDKVELDWPEHYAKSELAKACVERAHELVATCAAASQPLQVGSQYAMPFWTQTRVLLHKFNLAYWRSPGYNLIRVGMTFVASLVYLAIYWGEGHFPSPATIANVQNVMGIMFSSANFMGMTNLMSVMPVVGYERVVFYRERAASMYDAFAYGIAIALVEMPYLLVQACTFVPIMYFGIGFELTAEAFWYYFIVFFETIAFYTIFGQTLVYITPSQAMAQVFGGGFNFLFNVFNGFMITYPDIPQGWRWMNRAVPPTWILYGLGVSQLGNDTDLIEYGGVEMPINEFLQVRFGYQYYMRWWIVLILLAYILVLRVGSILALKYWNHLKR